MGSDGVREEQLEVSTRSNNQALYDASGFGSYAYGSTLDSASNQGSVYERMVGSSNQGAHVGRASIEDVNIRIPYQPYLRNFELVSAVSAGSNSSQPGMTERERRAHVESASNEFYYNRQSIFTLSLEYGSS
jgi:hypothetical protein